MGSRSFLIVNLLALALLMLLMLATAKPANAAVVCSTVAESEASTSEYPLVTASVTMTDGYLYLAWLVNTHGTSAAVASLDGGGAGSWDGVDTATFEAGQSRLTLFSKVGTGTSGTLTASVSGGSATGMMLGIVECSGANPTLVQTAKNTGTGTSGTVTFAGATAATSIAVGGVGIHAQEAVTPPATWTEHTDQAIGTPGTGSETASKAGSLTSAQWAWTSSGEWAGIMVEVGEAAPPTTTTTTTAPTTTTTAAPTTTTTSSGTPAISEDVHNTLKLGLGLIVFLLAALLGRGGWSG